MDVTFSTFLGQIVSNPVLAVTVILALGAIFVNGWTDAPNAIATCVTTRCMPARAAILMSAAFNFLGVLIMTHFNASVANTISHIVDFGGNSTMALACLCAALFSIVVYGATASRFGIPTDKAQADGERQATMGIGTSVGGERIIKSVGQSMVKLEKYQGFSADLALSK